MSDRQEDEAAAASSSSVPSASLAAQLRDVRARQAEAEAAQRRIDGDADDHEEALNLAHAQSHNPVDSLLPSPPQSPPQAVPSLEDIIRSRPSPAPARRSTRMVTVRDVKNRTCWICSDGDDGESKIESSRRWVHPCKCSLIAHESCLLTWIRSKRTNGAPDPNRLIICPQCSHPYIIVERKPSSLRLLEAGDRVLRSIVPVAGAAVLGGGVLIAATAYGCTAIRLWMGEKAARRTLGGRWPWHFYFDIPLIPFALVLSRLRFLDRALMWLPTIVAFPITHVPFASATLSWTQPYAPTWTWKSTNRDINPLRLYPPGPAVTILLVPWIRVAYLSLKRKITRRVLSSFVRRSSPRAVGAPGTQDVRRRVIVFGQEHQAIDAAGLGDVGVDAQGQPRELPPGADAVDDNATADANTGLEGEGEEQDIQQQTIYVTPQSLSRLCIGALSTPLIANVMGKLLAKLAGWSFLLRRLLGMHLKPVFSTLQDYGKNNAPKSPLARLFASSSARFENAIDEEERHFYPTYDDLDPVWFRNAIGAGLFIVAKDAVQLTYRYLRLNHARQGNKRTKIMDRPFEGSMVQELELRDDFQQA